MKTLKDIKKTWICIKSLVSMKHKNSDTPSIIKNDENTSVTQSQSQILLITAQTVQPKIKFSNKSLRSFLSAKNNDSFLLTATNKEEI